MGGGGEAPAASGSGLGHFGAASKYYLVVGEALFSVHLLPPTGVLNSSLLHAFRRLDFDAPPELAPRTSHRDASNASSHQQPALCDS